MSTINLCKTLPRITRRTKNGANVLGIAWHIRTIPQSTTFTPIAIEMNEQALLIDISVLTKIFCKSQLLGDVYCWKLPEKEPDVEGKGNEIIILSRNGKPHDTARQFVTISVFRV